MSQFCISYMVKYNQLKFHHHTGATIAKANRVLAIIKGRETCKKVFLIHASNG